ncbi:MAG: hypothetical protein ABR915_00735 [Thermoguttaceae bacterium]
MSIMADGDRAIRRAKLCEQGTERDLENTTPEQRIAMMWQLALDAWEMKGEPVVDARMRRDLVRVIRRKS